MLRRPWAEGSGSPKCTMVRSTESAHLQIELTDADDCDVDDVHVRTCFRPVTDGRSFSGDLRIRRRGS